MLAVHRETHCRNPGTELAMGTGDEDTTMDRGAGRGPGEMETGVFSAGKGTQVSWSSHQRPRKRQHTV